MGPYDALDGGHSGTTRYAVGGRWPEEPRHRHCELLDGHPGLRYHFLRTAFTFHPFKEQIGKGFVSTSCCGARCDVCVLTMASLSVSPRRILSPSANEPTRRQTTFLP